MEEAHQQEQLQVCLGFPFAAGDVIWAGQVPVATAANKSMPCVVLHSAALGLASRSGPLLPVSGTRLSAKIGIQVWAFASQLVDSFLQCDSHRQHAHRVCYDDWYSHGRRSSGSS